MTTENQNNTSITNTSSAGNGISKRLVAALLAIFLGCLGVHKFYLGINKVGLIYLLVSILGSFLLIPILVISVLGLIDSIKYLMCSDEEFERMYVQGKKAWF